MVLPYLTAIKSKAQMQDKFLGLNMRETCAPGQFTRMWNMSGDNYPYLSPRRKRSFVRSLDTSNGYGLLGGEALAWISGGHLYYDGQAICDVTSTAPQLVRMGAYLIVWPDRIVYNTHTNELSQMDASYSFAGVTIRPCMLSGQEYEYTASDTAPESPKQYACWYNTLTGGFYQWLGDEWQGIDTVYSRIEGPDLGKEFRDYDVVKLSGFPYDEYNLEAATVYARGDDYIVIATGTFRDYQELGSVSVSRTAPDMDMICECQNRLWGCSSEKHEIYGSKLGDPTNWHSFLGISTDSYAATVGSEGAFTGLNTYMGYVHFWKEDRCHRLYGTRPENYQLLEIPIRGVKQGCEKSLCVVGGVLYYVSRDGVMAFDGSSAVNIGDVLGDMRLNGAVCGAHGDKLYLSADISWPGLDTDTFGEFGVLPIEDGAGLTFALDTSKGLWHIEDDNRAVAYASTAEGDFLLGNDGGLWLIDGGESKYNAIGIHEEEDFIWAAETGDNGQESPNKLWLKRLTFRVRADRGARMWIDIQYDSDGRWHRALAYEAHGKRSETLKLRTMRCDHFRLRFYGIGMTEILSMAKTYDEGSER